ncbi:unnamed protein product [Lampetra fluviatilis]
MCASQLSRSALRCGGISTRRKSESVALKANGVLFIDSANATNPRGSERNSAASASAPEKVTRETSVQSRRARGRPYLGLRCHGIFAPSLRCCSHGAGCPGRGGARIDPVYRVVYGRCVYSAALNI